MSNRKMDTRSTSVPVNEDANSQRAKALSSTSWESNEYDGHISEDELEDEEEDTALLDKGTFEIRSVPNVWMTAKVWKEKSGWSGKFKKKTSQFLPLGHHLFSDRDDEKLAVAERTLVPNSTYDEDDEDSLWVRRQIVLDGHFLLYYHVRAEILHDAHLNTTTDSETRDHIHGGTVEDYAAKPWKRDSVAASFHSMWNHVESMILQHPRASTVKSSHAPHLQSPLGRQTVVQHQDTLESSALNTPRGVVDVQTSHVTISIASSSSSYPNFISTNTLDMTAPPTPFCLVVKINKKDNKWKLCFDSRDEMEKWLFVLSDLVVNKNVRNYNKQHGISKYREIVHKPSSYNPLEKVVAQQMRPVLERIPSVASYHDPVPSILDEEQRPRSTSLLENSPSFRDHNKSKTLQSWILARPDLYKIMLILNGAIMYAFIIGASIEGFFIFLCHILVCILFANSSFFLLLRKYDGYYSTEESHRLGMLSYLRQKKDVFLHYTRRKFFRRHSANYVTQDVPNNTFPTEVTPLILSRETSIRNQLSNRSIAAPRDLMSPMNTLQRQSSSSIVTREPSFRQPSDPSVESTSFDSIKTSKPLAGSTTCQITPPIHVDPSNEEQTSIFWSPSPSHTIAVRGPDYMVTKKKIPCTHALYQLVAFDVFESNNGDHPITPRIQLNPSTYRKDDETLQGSRWKSPQFFVISVALPTSTWDERGYSLVGYYKMRDQTRTVLEMISRDNYDPIVDDMVLIKSDQSFHGLIHGVKLWERWCRDAPSRPEMQSRFKFLARGDNLNEIGVMQWILNYNGKPILIKRVGQTGFLYDNMVFEEMEKDSLNVSSVMEFHLNLHKFPFLFRQAIVLLKNGYFSRMLATLAFVIEARSEEELPEVLIGDGLQLHYPNPQFIRPLF